MQHHENLPHHTMGGLSINTGAQVLDINGQVIQVYMLLVKLQEVYMLVTD